MQRLEVSGAVRLIYRSLGVKGLIAHSKGTVPPVTCHEGTICSFFTLDARWDSLVKATPRPLYPRERPANHFNRK